MLEEEQWNELEIETTPDERSRFQFSISISAVTSAMQISAISSPTNQRTKIRA